MATNSLSVNRDIILSTKRQHIKARQAHTPLEAVLSLARMQRRPRNFLNVTSDGRRVHLVAQVRRREIYDPVTAALRCVHAGADAIAFFTDHSIYDVDLDDMLMVARGVPDTPVMYQNYVMNEYSVMATRGSDASAVMIYASVLEPPVLRQVVSMAQRWKMTTVVQVNTADELEQALTLSPHALSFGDLLGDDLAQTIASVKSVLPDLPDYCRVLLTHPAQSLAELNQILSLPVDAVIVDEDLLKSEYLAQAVRDRIRDEQDKRR